MEELIELYREKLQELYQVNGFPDEIVFENHDGEYIKYNTEDCAWAPVDEDDFCEDGFCAADYE